MKKYFSVFLILMLSLPCMGAALAETLSVEQALETAAAHNPQIKAAQARLGVSDAAIITAGARINPAILSDNGVAEKTYRLGVEKTFELGGKRRRRIELAEGEREVVLTEIQTLLLDLRSNVRKAYTRLYSLQERQKSYRALLQTSDQLLQTAKKQEQTGDIAKVDVLQAEIFLLNAANEAETIGYEITQARSTLNILLNQPISEVIELCPPDSLPQDAIQGMASEKMNNQSVEPEQLIQHALEQRPEIRQNNTQQTVAQRQLALAQANRVPNLSLTAGPDLVTEGGQPVSVFVIGSVELPVLNRQQGPIQEAIARQAQLTQEKFVLENQIKIEVVNAYTSFLQNRQRIVRYESNILPKASEVVQKSQRSFEVGKSSILIPINAQQAYQNTQLGYQQSLLEYQNAISDLERALGSGL